MENVTYVFGHKNPDTDSVVSAWCFAQLKNLKSKKDGLPENYVAVRSGKLSPQAEYIFKKLNIVPPVFISDLTPKVEYYMGQNFSVINENQSLQFASSLMQKNDFYFLSVVDNENRYKGLLHYSAFARNLINSLNPEHHIKVFTNLNLLHESLGAILASGVGFIDKNETVEECTVLAGASDISSFIKSVESRREQKLIVITGDRQDVIKTAIEHRVYCVIVSGGRTISSENIALAVTNGVCLMISPFDTVSTSMLTSYATPVSVLTDCSVPCVKKSDSVQNVKNIFKRIPVNGLAVVNDDKRVEGIITENMLHHESAVSVSLVDHNEITQAVDGIENYTIKEIIDHHRIGAIPTKYPVTFINKPVGSTATIVAELYEESKFPVDANTAALLLAGILSDTLILKSATTTLIDIETAQKLSKIAGLDVQAFGEELIDAGSNITNRSAQDLVLQDLKEYKEGKTVFTVSQIETGSLKNVLSKKEEIFEQLELQRTKHGGIFSSLLVTDITRMDSLLFVANGCGFTLSLNFPMQEENIYLLKGIVSRKKQLIPLLTEIL